MKFLIFQHGIYGKWQRAVHLGTWHPMKWVPFGPQFDTYQQLCEAKK